MGYKFLVHPYHLHHHHLPQLFFVRLQLDDFIITANEIMGELLEDLLALYFFEHHLLFTCKNNLFLAIRASVGERKKSSATESKALFLFISLLNQFEF